MKFLEYTPLARLNSFLSHLNLHHHLIQGVLEAYSCKAAGIDKKLSRSVEQEVVEALAASPSDLASSSLGPLSSSQSRKALVYLILTLNHAHPDYDFSTVRSHQFRREESVVAVREGIDQLLVDAAKAWQEEGNESSFHDTLWAAMDDVIQLSDVEVYSYRPDVHAHIFTDTNSIWSFYYFFYNRKLKRVVYFTAMCRSKLRGETDSPDDGDSDDGYGDVAADMDL